MKLLRIRAIAIALLEKSISMNKIRYCSSEDLSLVAHRIGISLQEMEEFANEVAKRELHLRQHADAEKHRKASTLVLFTDDPECGMIALNLCMTEIPMPIAEHKRWLTEGYTVKFLVRNEECAKVWSEEFGVEIKTTQDLSPNLVPGSVIICPITRTDYKNLSDVRVPG